MVLLQKSTVTPAMYNVEYFQPVQQTVVRTYDDYYPDVHRPNYVVTSSSRSTGCSRFGSWCCLLSLLLCLLIAAGLAVGLYFIIKNAIDDNDNSKSSGNNHIKKKSIFNLYFSENNYFYWID